MPLRTQAPSARSATMVTSSRAHPRGWSANATDPVTAPEATCDKKRCRCSAVPTSRTMGANWVTVASSGPGAMARPNSSTTTAISTKERPMPPSSSGMVRAGQSSATIEPQSFSGGSPVSTTARTSSTGHSFWRNERTEVRSSSCSVVNSSSTALLSRHGRLPDRSPFHVAAPGRPGRVYLTPMSASPPLCYLHGAPFSGKQGIGCPRGGRRSEAQARAGDFGGPHQGVPAGPPTVLRRSRRGPLAYTLRCASSSTAEQRTLNPQVSGSNPEGRTLWALFGCRSG